MSEARKLLSAFSQERVLVQINAKPLRGRMSKGEVKLPNGSELVAGYQRHKFITKCLEDGLRLFL